MPRKFILGSGIVGLLAREILGADWEIIPFGRSRFYSFDPPLADNLITWHADIDEVISKFIFQRTPINHQRAYSFGGQLIFSDESFAKLEYIKKLFSEDPHPAARLLLRSSSMTYNISVAALYGQLLAKSKKDLAQKTDQWGILQKIEGNTLRLSNATFEFDKIVSTIPLYALLEYLGKLSSLPSRDAWYYHVETPALNFEGVPEILVCDAPYDFFKVLQLHPNQYIFHCLRNLGDPQAYLGAFTRNQIRILNQTSIERAIPVGVPPPLGDLENINIYPVGCHAQWDYFMDVGSCIRRLLRLRNV